MAGGHDPFDFSDVAGGSMPGNGAVGPSGPTTPTGPGFPTYADGGAVYLPFEPATLRPQDLVGALSGRPPLHWLIVGLLTAMAGAAAALLVGASAPLAFASWLVAGPIAIGMLAAFAMRDTDQRALPVYAAPAWTPVLYWAVVGAVVLGVALSAWRIADWAGRL